MDKAKLLKISGVERFQINILARKPILLSLKSQKAGNSGCYSSKSKPILWEGEKRIVMGPREAGFRAY